ncbi:MAG: LacI family DNA-binding transcriptional regulator [Pseudomonadota bacterium]
MNGNRQSAKTRLATMADVAATAGVSQITVSRALRNPDSVAPETRKKIAAAIKQVDYVPNGVAGSLRSRQTNLVAAIIPSITHHFLGRMIQGFSDVLSPSGLHLMLGTSGESLLGEERIVAAFLAQRPRGILLHNTEHTDACRQLLAQSGIPVIETGDLAPKPIDTAVGYSNFDAAFAMTRHLIERGYRCIAFVGRMRQNERVAERLRGYLEALKEAGIAEKSGPIIEAPAGLGGGAQVISQLLEEHPLVDAVFFGGDALAGGALLECNRRGVPVPGRIAIAGYDDDDLAAELKPSLTALRIPRYETGRRVAETLLLMLRDVPVPSNTIDLGFELLHREST